MGGEECRRKRKGKEGGRRDLRRGEGEIRAVLSPLAWYTI